MSLLAPILRERPPIYQVAEQSPAWHVVAVVSIGAFMGQLDASIISLALPTLEVDFHQTIAAVSWVAVSYLLTVATLVTIFGRLADLYGRKMLYTFGFVVFIIGSALCGTSPTLPFLVGARVLQGIGAAMLQANSVAIITAAVPRNTLGRAIGIQGAAQAVGLSVGPALGGILISGLGWRWIFFINVPAGLLGALLGWLLLPVTGARAAHEDFDWTGALLFAPGIIALMAYLTFAQQLGWLSPPALALLLAAAMFGVLFVRSQASAAAPLVDLAFFRNAGFSAGIASALASYTVLFGALFVVPFFLERVRGHDPAGAGLLLLPVPLALSVIAPVAGWVTDRYGPLYPTLGGMAAATLACILLGLVHRTTPYLEVAAALAIFGLGLGLFTPANNSSIMACAARIRLGVAGGLLNMTRGIGTALGVALTSAILSWQLAVNGHHMATAGLSPHVLAVSFRHTLWFLAGVAALGTLISLRRHN